MIKITDTSAKIAVQVSCSDRTLNAAAVDTIPQTVIKTCGMTVWTPTSSRPTRP